MQMLLHVLNSESGTKLPASPLQQFLVKICHRGAPQQLGNNQCNRFTCATSRLSAERVRPPGMAAAHGPRAKRQRSAAGTMARRPGWSHRR
jgi:hypothetical protein